MRIKIVPLSPLDTRILDFIIDGISKVADGLDVYFGEEVKLPFTSFNAQRGQYLSKHLLDILSKGLEEGEKILGVTGVDVYAQGLSFVIGEAEFKGNVALVSHFRLKPEISEGQNNVPLFLNRCLKESIHEIGHTIGLMHCSNSTCVMCFSSHIDDTDKKSNIFCSKCNAIFMKNLIDSKTNYL